MNAFDTAWTHIRRSPYQAVAAVLSMFLTLLLAGSAVLASFTSLTVLGYFEGKPQLTVFFSEEAESGEIDSLKKSLEETGKVSSVKFISKDEALAIYKEQNKNDPLLLEMVTAEILPASLEVNATAPQHLTQLDSLAKEAKGVEEVVFQKDIVDMLLSWTDAIRLIGGILTGLLAVNSLLVIVTIVGMKIALRKEEVEIFNLIGASPWYVRFPFILEGIFYGVAGGFLAFFILETLVLWFRPQILTFFGSIPAMHQILADTLSIQFAIESAAFLCLLLAIGAVLGIIGSVAALGRYLKFQ